MAHNRSRRWLVIAVFFTVVIAVAVLNVMNNLSDKPSSGKAPVSSSSPIPERLPSQSPAQSSSAGTTDPAQEFPAGTSQGDAVNITAAVLTQLSGAMFSDSGEVRAVVRSLVVSPKREPLTIVLPEMGKQLSTMWGYTSSAEAAAKAGYFVQLKQYKVDSVNSKAATIRAYVLTHWVTSINQEYLAPSITVIHLRVDNGRWLYAGSTDPTADQAPEPLLDLSYQQTVARFTPFLKGFTSYEESGI